LYRVTALVAQPKSQQVCITLCVSWKDGGNTLNIRRLIHFKRSAYDTGPFATVLAAQSDDDDGSVSILDPFTQYKTANGTPWYATLLRAPTRQGFDVGFCLSLQTFLVKYSLNSLRLLLTSSLEVGRDDLWVQRLLCC